MTAPLTDAALSRLADTLSVALLLHAQIRIVDQPAQLGACWNCPPGVDRPAAVVLAWRPADYYRAWWLREPTCLPCLPGEVRGMAALHPTIEIPAGATA